MTNVDALERLLAVVEELVVLVARLEHLRASVDQLEEVGPRLVDVVLPLGNHGRLSVSGANLRVAVLVRQSHSLLPNRFRLTTELTETLLQHLQ